MTEYYLDASALVKRYADEAGSGRIRQITAREAQHTILLAEMTLAEVAAGRWLPNTVHHGGMHGRPKRPGDESFPARLR